jgi:hypothetical protein
MKVLGIRDLYFEPVAVSSNVAWGRASASTRSHLRMAYIGKGQFPSDYRQRTGNYRQDESRPHID